MPDDPSNDETTDADDGPEPTRYVPERDLLLQYLSHLAHEGVLGIGVSLTVGGAIVTGFLVSRAEYVRGSGELFASVGSEDMTNALRLMEEQLQDLAGEDPPMFFEYGYVNLEQAQILIGGAGFMPTTDTIWWRGRISAVDGWNFGIASDGSQPPRAYKPRG